MRVIVLMLAGLPLSFIAASKAAPAWHATGLRAVIQAVAGGALAGSLIGVVFFLTLLPQRPGDTSWSNHVGQSLLFGWSLGFVAAIFGAVIGVVVAVTRWRSGG